MQSNETYNDYLNSGDIIIAMSGGEGWGLPEFHSLALGKHGVILNAHVYKDWANEENSCLVRKNIFVCNEKNCYRCSIQDGVSDDCPYKILHFLDFWPEKNEVQMPRRSGKTTQLVRCANHYSKTGKVCYVVTDSHMKAHLERNFLVSKEVVVCTAYNLSERYIFVAVTYYFYLK
jgi:hypothetical protein